MVERDVGDDADQRFDYVGGIKTSANADFEDCDFDRKFQAEYSYRSDHNGMKGYSAAYVLKAVTEKVGAFDSQAVAKAMHGLSLSVKDHPGILMDVTYDEKGDLDRESFMVKVEGGKQVVFATVPPLGAKAH